MTLIKKYIRKTHTLHRNKNSLKTFTLERKLSYELIETKRCGGKSKINIAHATNSEDSTTQQYDTNARLENR